MLKDINTYNFLPPGWKIDEKAPTAPRGFVWINNGKSRFSCEYEKGLMKLYEVNDDQWKR